MADAFDIAAVGPPAGTQIFEHAAHFAVRMDGGENGLARADVVVKLGGDIQRVVSNQQRVVSLADCGESFLLRQKALQLDHVAKLQQSVAVARFFDAADETEQESRLDIRRQRLQRSHQRRRLGRAVDCADVGGDDPVASFSLRWR